MEVSMRLTDRIKSCTSCPLLVSSRTQVVIGEGPVPCDYLFLGEAPGRHEDKTGRPFIGASGHLMRLYAAKVGLPEGTYHILNVLKCRPPENRDPTPEEISNCRGFLLSQIKALKPKAAIAFGRYAHAFFIGESNPNKIRVLDNAGKVIDYKDIKVVLTFHPAYVLRNRETAIEKAFRAHLKLAKKLGE